MYNAEIIFHEGSEREFAYEDSFSTPEEAMAYIRHNTLGHVFFAARINNERVNP